MTMANYGEGYCLFLFHIHLNSFQYMKSNQQLKTYVEYEWFNWHYTSNVKHIWIFFNYFRYLRFGLMLGLCHFQQYFNYIVEVSFIGNCSRRRKPSTCNKSMTNFITCFIEYALPWAGFFELTTFVVIGTNCTGSWKSNYYMITTSTALIDVLIEPYTIISFKCNYDVSANCRF